VTRDSHLHIRLSAPERDALVSAAERAGVDVSAYIRDLVAAARRPAHLCPKCKGRGVL
jgi:uncharacterized protein (DUF1778 family)